MNITSIYIELLLIAVFIAAFFYSGFVKAIEDYVNSARRKNGKIGRISIPKPFSCGLCMTWWTCLAWIIFRHEFTLFNVTFCIVLALFDNFLQYVIDFVITLLETIVVKITNRL